MHLLLDACTFIWLAAEPKRLGKAVRAAIDDPENELVLSDVTVWEICLKWQLGKLKLPEPPRRWVQAQASTWQVTQIPIDREHLYRVTELPEHHADPFDRLMVAQAIEESLTIATPDAAIVCYPVSCLW